MNNKEIMQCLRRLKDEGISYKYIAQQSGIPIENFYKCTHKKIFPLDIKHSLEKYLFSTFEEIIFDECINTSYKRY